MADPRARRAGSWSRAVALILLQSLAGCGAKPPRPGVGATTPPQTPSSAREVATLQAQIQQTERSSRPPQVKQQVEANLNAQIQTKQQTPGGQ